MARVAVDNVVVDQRLSLFEIGGTESADAVRRQYGVDRAEIANDTIDIIASEVDVLRTQYRDPERFQRALAENLRTRFARIEGNREELTVQAGEIERIVADLTDVETGLQTRATIDELQQAQVDNESARGQLSSTLRTEFQDADSALQSGINSRATVSELQAAQSDNEIARGEIASSIRAEYTASDDALENEINNRATRRELQLAQATNEEARGELSTSLQADYNGQLDTKAEITYVDQAVADEAGARARQYSNLSASSPDNLFPYPTSTRIRAPVDKRWPVSFDNANTALSVSAEIIGTNGQAFTAIFRGYDAEGDQTASATFANTTAGGFRQFKADGVVFPGVTTEIRVWILPSGSSVGAVFARRIMVNRGPLAMPYAEPGAGLNQSGQVQQNREVLVSATEGPLAREVRRVSVSDGDDTATVEQQFTAARNDLGELLAQVYLRAQGTTADGAPILASLGIGVEGEESNIILAADKVSVWDSQGERAVWVTDTETGRAIFNEVLVGLLTFGKLVDDNGTFIVEDGRIKGAFIQVEDAQITRAMIANAAIGSAQIEDAAVGTLQIAGNAVTRTTTAQRLTTKEFGRYEEGHVLTLAIPPTNTGENETALLAFSSNYEFDDDSATETASLRINSTLEGDIFNEVVEEDRLPDARKNFSLQLPVQIRHNSYTYIRMYMTLGGDNVKAVYFAYMTCLDLYDE